MPPKKKGSSKKPAKANTPTLIGGLTMEEITKEQLEEHIVRLREELARKREERNYFQLERDKICTMCKITERQLEEAKAEEKKLDKRIEEDERRHQEEIKVYKQKMKHLLCEHQNTISELKADGLASVEMVQKEQEQLETELHDKMRTIMVDVQELDNENLVKDLEMKHDEEMTKAKNNWEKKFTENKTKHEKELELRRQELDNIRKHFISETEDQWRSHISALTDHNKKSSEAEALLKHMQEDLAMNTSLKSQIEEAKKQQKEKEKDLHYVLQDNKHLAELISKTKEEIAENEKKMKYYAAKKDVSMKAKKKELKDLKLAHEALEEKFSKLQLERDELHKTFAQNMEELQRREDEKIVQLERKLRALTDSLEKTQTQYLSVLSASNMDPTALSAITKQFEDYLDSRNDSIKKLKDMKAQISRAHKDLLLTYEAKQRALGVPV